MNRSQNPFTLATPAMPECKRTRRPGAVGCATRRAVSTRLHSHHQKEPRMIDGLLSGKLYGKPEERTSKTGKPFATARMRVPTKDGDSIFASCIAFDTSACRALLALADGDALTVAGTLTLKGYLDKEGQPRPGVDVVAHHVLTAYHVQRKRDAMKSHQSHEADALDDGAPLEL